MQVEWAKLTGPALRERAAAANSLAILPIGALEQHGPHLPTITDTASAEAVSLAAAKLISVDQAVAVLPGLWLGMSEHHLPFGGTISVDFAVLRGMLQSVARSLKSAGFKRLLVVNGHGGNIDPLAVAVREVAVACALPVCTTTPWALNKAALAQILDDDEEAGHACEGETSVMLALLPDHVRREKFAEAFDKQKLPLRHLTEISRFYSFSEHAPVTGTWGNPKRASADKGRAILALHAAELVKVINNPLLWSAPDQVWAANRGQGRTDGAVPAPEK